MVLRSSYFLMLRMLRNYVGWIIMLVTPVALITVLGFLADNALNEQLGITMKASVAATMVLAFQLFSGFFMMELMKSDLLSARKWRMYALPLQPHQHTLAILLVSTLFSALQGFIIVLYTFFMYDIDWGNLLYVVFVLIAVSLLSQLVFLNLVLGVSNYKTAERLGTTFGIVSLMIAEVWFTLPDNPIFNFLSTYGNPLSLGMNMIVANMTGDQITKAGISAGVVVAVAITLCIVATIIGRRKLA